MDHESNRNLIISSEVTADVFVESSGKYSNVKGHFITGFIEVKANEVYTISMLLQGNGNSRVAYYDLDKNFIKRDLFKNQEITQIKPEQDGFIRWSPDVDRRTGGYGPGYKIEKATPTDPVDPEPVDPEPVDPEPEPEMVYKLQGTFNGVELWYDSNIMNAEMTTAPKNVYPTMKLKEGLYFKTPMTFILKRDTRADFNYKSPDSDAYLVGGLYTYTINSVKYNYGMDKLNMGRDTNTKRVEIVVDTNNIGKLSELPPETVEIKVPDYSGENEYANLIDSGKVTLKVNGEILTTTNNVTVNKYGNFDIEIINNQLNQQFDYDDIRFTKEKYNGTTGSLDTIEFTPDVKTPDKMIYHVNSLTWNRYINDGNIKTFTPYALPYLAFKAKEVKPVEDYPFLNIYKVDDDSLNTLAKEVNERRYLKDVGADGTVIKDYDVSRNIIDLVRIPYAIQTEPDLEYINLNNEAMESQGKQILNYVQEINLGKIHCYHDTLVNIGYKNIEFNLFVPNFKPISLDVSKVIDRTIEMNLNLDLTTGQGTLNLLMDGIAFHVEQEKISKDIPFKTDNNRISLEDNVLNTKYLNPYLEIIVLNPDNTINTQELKQRKINRSSLLYAKSDNIILNSKATYNEQLEIEMLVRKGVYING